LKERYMVMKQFIIDSITRLRTGNIDAWANIKPLEFPETDTDRKYTDFDGTKYRTVLAELSVTHEELAAWEMRYLANQDAGTEDMLDTDPNYDWIKGEP
jgi:hypothetical protein